MTSTGLDVRVDAVSKRFGETQALRAVSLELRAGSVHALVGENGAGKSTLGRIVSGLIAPDEGALILDGEAVGFRSPRDALERGIATIAQELSLVPALTAAENVLLGVEPRRFGFVDRRRMAEAYSELAERAGFDVPAGRPVRSLSIARQQEVEILRAIARDARLIVMDEPSARLSAVEAAKLHALIRRFTETGRSVLLITHFLGEVLRVADEVTVLRDGQVVRHGSTHEETEDSLIEAMLGREQGEQFPERRPPIPDSPVVLRVERISGPGFADVSLEVRAGEIVGLAGLVGAGRTELGRAIVGVVSVSSGSIEIAGHASPPRSPRDARRQGAVLIPESRRDDGLFPMRPTRENVSIMSLDELSRMGFVELGRERRSADERLRDVGVIAAGDTPARALSGGNQQKVLFARVMLAGPRLLIADEPTRGVDVGAKRAIYELLVRLAAEGMAVLLISSEMEEILGLSHRVLVMRGGRIAADLSGAGISEAAILNAAFEAPAQRGPVA